METAKREKDYRALVEILERPRPVRTTQFINAPIGSLCRITDAERLTIIKKISAKSVSISDPKSSEPNGVEITRRCSLVCIPNRTLVEVLDPKRVHFGVKLDD